MSSLHGKTRVDALAPTHFLTHKPSQLQLEGQRFPRPALPCRCSSPAAALVPVEVDSETPAPVSITGGRAPRVAWAATVASGRAAMRAACLAVREDFRRRNHLSRVSGGVLGRMK